MITKLRTSFLLPAELTEITSKFISTTEQANITEPYVQKLLDLLRKDVKDLNKALTSLRVNSMVVAAAEADGIRDDLFIAFRDTVEIGKRRQKTEIMQAYQKVFSVLEKADLRLYRLGYTEKSGRLAALFSEMDQPDFQANLVLLNADELYIELKEAEDNFQSIYAQRLNEDISNSAPGIVEARRKAVPHVNIFLGVLSTLEVFEPEVYEILAPKINAITAEIMAIARARKTRNENDEIIDEDNTPEDDNS